MRKSWVDFIICRLSYPYKIIIVQSTIKVKKNIFLQGIYFYFQQFYFQYKGCLFFGEIKATFASLIPPEKYHNNKRWLHTIIHKIAYNTFLYKTENRPKIYLTKFSTHLSYVYTRKAVNKKIKKKDALQSTQSYHSKNKECWIHPPTLLFNPPKKYFTKPNQLFQKVSIKTQ